MLSVVVPTMQKNPKVFYRLLKILVNDTVIKEIIVIDNSGKGLRENLSEKIKVINPKSNLYVNPSWNLGVKEAECEYIGILNDDLIFPEGFFSQVLKKIKSDAEIGFMGIEDLPKTNIDDEEILERSILKFKELGIRGDYWGIAIFFAKNKYFEIPEEMKIWCGDDYLIDMSKKSGFRNFEICNTNIKHLHSLTSSRKEFDEIKYNDQKVYKTINPDYNFKFGNSLNIGQKIFSIKNEYKNGYKYKILRILGFKFTKCIVKLS